MPGPRRRLRVALLALIVCAVAPLSLAPRAAQPAPQLFAAWQHTVDGVAPALRALLPDQGRNLVSAIAADIDADGDLDVIASDSNLDLFVWVNDGHGHLSQRNARVPSNLAPAPLAPAVQERPLGPIASIQTDPPSLVAALRVSSEPRAPARAFGGAVNLLPIDASTFARIPRAPPAALFL
jgi:hypothetical protein